jgi:hypothetical protein
VSGGARDPLTAPDELLREAGRVADRLRVLGPRWAARDAVEDAEALLKVREALQTLADLARADGGSPRRVPHLRPFALGDQALVLAYEACGAGTADRAHDVLVRLRRSL